MFLSTYLKKMGVIGFCGAAIDGRFSIHTISNMTVGYSKTSLLKKLGIKPNFTLWLVNVPDDYLSWLGDLPDGVNIITDEESTVTSCHFVHFFSKERKQLEATLPSLKAALATNGMLWLSWPKKSAKIPTDLNGNVIRELGLAAGLVDVKVAAVSDIWSGHKFVYRLAERPNR